MNRDQIQTAERIIERFTHEIKALLLSEPEEKIQTTVQNAPAVPLEPKLWKKKDVAEYLQVSVRFVDEWVHKGMPFRIVGDNEYRFKRDEIDEWCQKNAERLRAERARGRLHVARG